MKGQIVGPLQFGGMNLTCDGKQMDSLYIAIWAIFRGAIKHCPTMRFLINASLCDIVRAL